MASEGRVRSKRKAAARAVDVIFLDVLAGVERGDGLTPIEWDRLDLFGSKECEHGMSTAFKHVASDVVARTAPGFSATLTARIEHAFELLSKATVRELVDEAVPSPEKLPSSVLDRIQILLSRVANVVGVPTGDVELDHYSGMCIYAMLLATRRYERRPCAGGDERVWRYLEKTPVAGRAASNCMWGRAVIAHVIRSCDFTDDWRGAASALRTNPALVDHVRDVASSLHATGMLADLNRVNERMGLADCRRPRRSVPKTMGVEWHTPSPKRKRSGASSTNTFEAEVGALLDAAAEHNVMNFDAALNLIDESYAAGAFCMDTECTSVVNAPCASQSTLLEYYPVQRGRAQTATKATQTTWKTDRVRRPPNILSTPKTPTVAGESHTGAEHMLHGQLCLEADEPALAEYDDTNVETPRRRQIKYVIMPNITKHAYGDLMQRVVDELSLPW